MGMKFGLRSVELSLRPLTRHMKKAHWFIIFLLFAISCLDEPDCFRLNNNIIGIAFKKMYDGKADTVALIGTQAVNANDTIFGRYRYTNELYLPLDFFNKQTSFTIVSLTDVNHLLFKYDVKTQFVSEDCGARYVLTGLSLDTADYDYDSVLLISTTPYPSAAGIHLNVYRCPRTNLMKLTFRQLQGETSVALSPKMATEGIVPDYTGALYGDTTLNAVALPLNPGSSSARFNFNFRDYGSNFVTVQYERKHWDYQNRYCGANQQVYHDLKVNTKANGGFDFDSLLVTKDTNEDPPVTNIVAYRCPDTNLMRLYFRTAAPVRVDRLPISKITNNRGDVVFGTDTTEFFTLPLLTGNDETTGTAITQTEFTFEFTDGTPNKKLTIVYDQQNAGLVFGACSNRQKLVKLKISATDFASGPTTDQYLPKVDSTTFPPSTNFEIIR